MKDEVRAGLDSASKLVPGHGEFDLTAGVAKDWGGGMDAFVRAELQWHPTDNLDAFAFAQADGQGASAGLGARVRF